MRCVAVEELKPGMIVAQQVNTRDGRLMLNVGVVLKPWYIDRLASLGIQEVWVEEDSFPEVGFGTTTANPRLGPDRVWQEALTIVADVIQDVRMGRALSVPRIRKVAEMVVQEVLSRQRVLVRLGQIKALDDYTFAHSLQVCVFTVTMGRALGYSFPELVEIGIGALLHDIGKTRIPLSLLNKPAHYTEEEYTLMKHHAAYGEAILRETEGLSVEAVRVAAEHHEWFNGQGYFRGLRGSEIHEFSQIVCLADVYDAMTTERSYRQRLLPHIAMEYIMTRAGAQFAPDLAETFLETVGIFPIDALVELTNGEVGRVVDVQHDLPSRPVVQVLFSPEGKPVIHRKIRDLRVETTLFVSRVLNYESTCRM